jgi:hypothetical protein
MKSPLLFTQLYIYFFNLFAVTPIWQKNHKLHSNLESSRLHSNLESARLHSTTPLHLLAHAFLNIPTEYPSLTHSKNVSFFYKFSSSKTSQTSTLRYIWLHMNSKVDYRCYNGSYAFRSLISDEILIPLSCSNNLEEHPYLH